MEKAIPALREEWGQLEQRLANTSAKVAESRDKLAVLKERVAAARDKANRIRLGAHFERGAFLELPLPQPSEDLAAFNEIRAFFRTRETNGDL